MENEIMNTVEEVMENNEVIETSGNGMGVGVLIGAGLCAAGYAAYKGVKKGIAYIKAKKEEKEVLVIEDTSDSVLEDVEEK